MRIGGTSARVANPLAPCVPRLELTLSCNRSMGRPAPARASNTQAPLSTNLRRVRKAYKAARFGLLYLGRCDPHNLRHTRDLAGGRHAPPVLDEPLTRRG